jgi:hypothetical protein
MYSRAYALHNVNCTMCTWKVQLGWTSLTLKPSFCQTAAFRVISVGNIKFNYINAKLVFLQSCCKWKFWCFNLPEFSEMLTCKLYRQPLTQNIHFQIFLWRTSRQIFQNASGIHIHIYIMVIGTSFRIYVARGKKNTILGSKRRAWRSTPQQPQQTPCCLEMSNRANTPSQHAPPPPNYTAPFLLEVRTLC